jgi:hypothetical protein
VDLLLLLLLLLLAVCGVYVLCLLGFVFSIARAVCALLHTVQLLLLLLLLLLHVAPPAAPHNDWSQWQ